MFSLMTALGVMAGSVSGQGTAAPSHAATMSRHYVQEVQAAPLPPAVEGNWEKLAWKALPPGTVADRAAPQPAMTIVELQALAAQYNPTLRILRQKINAAQGDWVQAGLKPNPVIGLEMEEIGSGGKAGKHGVMLEQEIITGGKRKLDRNVAGWEKSSARRRWELQCQAIQNDVTARAYELLAARRIVAINETLAEIGRQSVLAVRELEKAGEVSKIDLLQIRAKANESQAMLVSSRHEEKLAWKKLATMVGLQDLGRHTIDDSLEDVRPSRDRETAWHWMLECSPQIALAKIQIGQARTALQREYAEKKPDLTVGGGVYYDYGDRQALAAMNIGVPLKIFDRNQGNIRKAHAELAAACRELERLTLVLHETFEEYYTTLEISREQVLLYREKILPDVEQSLQMSVQGYKQGEYDYRDVLAARQIFLESQTQYVRSLKDYAVACVYLDGYLAQGGLEE